MRIAVIMHDTSSYQGGPLLNMKRILPKLRERGHEVYALIGYHGYSSSVKYFQSHGIKCLSTRWPKYTETYLRWILKSINSIRPDVFIADYVLHGAYAGKWIKANGIPTVICQRGVDNRSLEHIELFGGTDEEWAASGMTFVNRFLYDKATAAARVPMESQVIPSGVELSASPTDQSGNRLKLVYVGRLEQDVKRVCDILDSAIRLLDKGLEIDFTFIGDGTNKSALQERVSNSDHGEHVSFVDFLENASYYEELAKHHVIVSFSDHEGMPGSIMAGMSCGLVPVCTNTDGIEELITNGENGFIITNRTENFDAVIGKLKNTQLRKELSKAAISRIMESFSIESCVERWDELLKVLVNREGPIQTEMKIPTNFKLPAVMPAFHIRDKRATTSWQLLKDQLTLLVVNFKANLRYHGAWGDIFSK